MHVRMYVPYVRIRPIQPLAGSVIDEISLLVRYAALHSPNMYIVRTYVLAVR